MKIIQLQAAKLGIPPHVTKLLLRAALLFGAWLLAYSLVIAPWGVPDAFLTGIVVKGTVALLSLFFADAHAVGNDIVLNGVEAVSIANSCNGLELIMLYLGIIILMPQSIKKMAIFIGSGIVVITILNIFRCSALAYMFLHEMDMADFAHHYVFKIIIYAVVFYGWVLYTKKNKA